MLATDAFPQLFLSAHDGVVDYVGAAGSGPFPLRRVGADGTIETKWSSDAVPVLEANGDAYLEPFIDATEFWRTPVDGPYDPDLLASVTGSGDEIADHSVGGGFAWLAIDDCARGWFETGDRACTSRLDRIDLAHVDAGPETVASAPTSLDGPQIGSVRATDDGALYVLDSRLHRVDASGTDAVVADDVRFVFTG